jgi:hypothetical protein
MLQTFDTATTYYLIFRDESVDVVTLACWGKYPKVPYDDAEALDKAFCVVDPGHRLNDFPASIPQDQFSHVALATETTVCPVVPLHILDAIVTPDFLTFLEFQIGSIGPT